MSALSKWRAPARAFFPVSLVLTISLALTVILGVFVRRISPLPTSIP